MDLETAHGDEKASAVDQAVDSIRTLMRERNLVVGDALPSEIELATMFGTSRNTIREAIRMLKAYGVVESRQKVGAVITDRRQQALMELFSFAIDISEESFLDIQGFRRLVEVNLADALLVNVDEAGLVRLDEINQLMKDTPDFAQAAAFDFEFHATLIGFAGNRTLEQVYGILRPLLQRLMEAGKRSRAAVEASFYEHKELVDAIRKRDRLAYMYHMNKHLHAGLKFLA